MFDTLFFAICNTCTLLDRPAGRASWMDQLDRPARETSWTDQLDRPAEQNSSLYLKPWPVHIFKELPFSLGERSEKQAGAELGQAQLQLELGFTLLSWVCL